MDLTLPPPSLPAAEAGPSDISPAERLWRERQERWLARSRAALFGGVAGLILMAPWEAWSTGVPWYACLALVGVSVIVIPWFGGQLNWAAFGHRWCLGLALFVAMAVITSMTSSHPAMSWRLLRKELLVYTFVFLGIVLGATSRRELHRLVLTLAVSGLLACAMGIAAYHFYLHGADEVTRVSWVHEEVVDHDVTSDPLSLRAQFPLEHHNKLGFFAAVMALVLVHVGAMARRGRWLWWLSVLVPLWALVLTLNRGGLVGLLMSVFIVTLAANWRATLAFAAAVAVLILFVLPAHVRHHYATIFEPNTYRDHWTSMTYRTRGWESALNMIRAHPLLGVGYSWQVFEREYPRYAVADETQIKPHAHNIWLEIASETGLLGGIGFVIFQLGLLGATWRAWWRRRRRDQELGTLITLQLLILIVGMISYYLRDQLGVITWSVLALSLATLSLPRENEAAETSEDLR